VRPVQPALAGLGLLAAVLVGCGSSSPPSLMLSCSQHRLPSGALRIAAKVRNNTQARQDALLFGSALAYVTHEYPALTTRQVTVKAAGKSSPHIALLVPHIKAGGVARILLRFTPPPHPASLGVAIPSLRHAATLSGPTCLVARRL
jgi:hypothetical protein